MAGINKNEHEYKLNLLEYILQFLKIKIVSTNSFLRTYSTYEIIVVDTQVKENILMFGKKKSKHMDKLTLFKA